MKKISVYIDGLNLYHAIDNLVKAKQLHNSLKWVSLTKLAETFIDTSTEEIAKLCLFIADPIHKSSEIQTRHANFVRAQAAQGAVIIRGKFKKEAYMAYDKKGEFIEQFTHKEKETDVNIATEILTDAFQKFSDKVLLISNDSDISPAIRRALEINPDLTISVITPPLPTGRNPNHDLLDSAKQIRSFKKQIFRDYKIIQKIHLQSSLLPQHLITRYGKEILRPKPYDPT